LRSRRSSSTGWQRLLRQPERRGELDGRGRLVARGRERREHALDQALRARVERRDSAALAHLSARAVDELALPLCLREQQVEVVGLEPRRAPQLAHVHHLAVGVLAEPALERSPEPGEVRPRDARRAPSARRQRAALPWA
jgi:hypothetical protein